MPEVIGAVCACGRAYFHEGRMCYRCQTRGPQAPPTDWMGLALKAGMVVCGVAAVAAIVFICNLPATGGQLLPP